MYNKLKRLHHGNMLNAMREQIVLRALKDNKGNKTQAAKALGVSRRTLMNYIDEFSITTPDIGSISEVTMREIKLKEKRREKIIAIALKKLNRLELEALDLDELQQYMETKKSSS